ncbi:hypothetical protein [Hyphococcus sp.]|uniref:hypothetical protein n=1 Tax=Hyphococcus sp. TaxID=2038636 RepID=UPI0035C6E3A1
MSDRIHQRPRPDRRKRAGDAKQDLRKEGRRDVGEMVCDIEVAYLSELRALFYIKPA